MTDTSPSEGPAPVAPQPFVARRARAYGVGGLLGLGGATGFCLWSLQKREAGAETWVLLGFMVLLLFGYAQLLFRPPRFIVDGGLFRTNTPVELQTPLANLRSLAFDEDSLVVTFHDLDQVEPAVSRDSLREQTQADVRLLGFTLKQVEEIRRTLGILPPNLDEPGGRAEAFHRALLAATPRVYATYGLLGLNVVLFGLMVLTGVGLLNPNPQSLIRWGANFGPLTTRGEWWRLFTAMFLHIGVLHLLCNMWALWVVGVLLERLVGSLGLLVLYLLAGLVGSVASLYFYPRSISAGASGAIFGLFGGLLGVVLVRRKQVPLEIFSRLWSSGLTFLVFNLYIGLRVPGIDLAAHLGGWAFGLVGGLLLSRPLGVESRGHWSWRPLLLAGTGGLAVVLAASRVPTPSRGLGEFTREFAEAEQELLDGYNSLVKRVQSGKAKEEELATVLEQSILPRWRAYRRRLREIGDLPPKQLKRRESLLEYMKAREEGWELLVRAIRTQDAALGARAAEKFKLAEQIIERMKTE
jgi:membrane associated rhomboid family serine protease